MAKNENTSSVPRFDEFSPFHIKWQHQVLYDLQDKTQFDFTKGTHTIVLSGAVGSAKSLLAAHLTWRHILMNPGADVGLGRLDLRRLRETSVDVFIKHRPKSWELNKNGFLYNKSMVKFSLPNSSVVSTMYWSDGDFERYKGRQFSFFHLEEATENETSQAYKYISQRMGRLTHVNEKLIVITTNPDEPDHWLNQELISRAGWVDGKKVEGDETYLDNTIHVYYSLTEHNPFLGEGYFNNMLKKYSPLEVERFLRGKWVSLFGKGIYYPYSEEHYLKQDYKVDTRYAVNVFFDFNTAINKPMSCCFFQYIAGKFHFFDEVVLQGNTTQIMEEITKRGLLDHNTEYKIGGDAAGWAKQSSSNSFCDYDIINKVLGSYLKKDGTPLKYKIIASRSNPEVKVRHNTVNSQLKNGLNEIRLFVYGNCKVLNEGFKLTKLKDGSKYIEDDSKPYQHITTAAGYGVCETLKAPASITVVRG